MMSPFKAYRLAAEAERANEYLEDEDLAPHCPALAGKVACLLHLLREARKRAEVSARNNRALRAERDAALAKIDRMTSGLKQRQSAA